MPSIDGLAYAHPALVHFPIVLLAYGLGCEAVAAVRPSAVRHFAQNTLAIGVALCLPTIVSGWAASTTVPGSVPTARMLQLHTMAALGLFFAGATYTGLRWLAHEWRAPRALTLGLAAVVVTFLLAAGGTGGRLTRGMQRPTLASLP